MKEMKGLGDAIESNGASCIHTEMMQRATKAVGRGKKILALMSLLKNVRLATRSRIQRIVNDEPHRSGAGQSSTGNNPGVLLA